jgi:hypothetical protein
MPQLLGLSNDLVQCIASWLHQVDLLNVSLTYKKLRNVTERELFREYQSPHLEDSLLISSFILRIVRSPYLARYVKTLDLNKWHTLEDRNSFDGSLEPEPTEDEYVLLTAAAKEADIINVIHDYEETSSVITKMEEVILSLAKRDGRIDMSPDFVQRSVFGACASFDRKFCLLLRTGIEDAYVILLIAILPNLTDISLHDARSCDTSLDWPLPRHGFKSLRRVIVDFEAGRSTQCLSYVNTVLASPNFTALAVQSNSQWTAKTSLWSYYDSR